MIKRYYEFRVLTADGLLKPVKPDGPYYDQDTTLCTSYESREAAEAALLAKAQRDTSEFGGGPWSDCYVIVEFVLVAP